MSDTEIKNKINETVSSFTQGKVTDVWKRPTQEQLALLKPEDLALIRHVVKTSADYLRGGQEQGLAKRKVGRGVAEAMVQGMPGGPLASSYLSSKGTWSGDKGEYALSDSLDDAWMGYDSEFTRSTKAIKDKRDAAEHLYNSINDAPPIGLPIDPSRPQEAMANGETNTKNELMAAYNTLPEGPDKAWWATQIGLLSDTPQGLPTQPQPGIK
jgi:hypothetical protein